MTNQTIINQFIFQHHITTKKILAVSPRKALSIRGGKLYSYNVLIGEYITTEGFSGILIHDHWAKGLGVISSTTSQHVGMLIRATQYHPRRLKSELGSMF